MTQEETATMTTMATTATTATRTRSSTSSLVLPTIVFCQFAGTSLWFAPNAVVSQIEGFGERETAALVSSVQSGFILGTLGLTYFAATDRISPPLLFTTMALTGAALNLLCVATSNFPLWVLLRILVGVCLAGVYPVGMKIAATEYPTGLGARLGVLVGALTLGTAFPWLVRGLGGAELPVVATLATVSVLAILGALIMAVIMIPRQGGPGTGWILKRMGMQDDNGNSNSNNNSHDGDSGNNKSNNKEEELPKDDKDGIQDATSNDGIAQKDKDEIEQQEPSPPPSSLVGLAALRAIFRNSGFRAAALGYFGHMWELYAFWAHVPSLIRAHAELNSSNGNDSTPLMNLELTTFCTIAIGSISCALGGVWSLHAGRNIVPGSFVVAELSLILSGTCCFIAPMYKSMSHGVFFFFLLVWGAAVVADSAQFSSLCATYAHKKLVGTALTLSTCIGFTITVVSIQLIGALLERGWDPGNALTLLAIGPVLGILRTYVEWPLHSVLFQTTTAKNNSNDDEGEEKEEEQQTKANDQCIQPPPNNSMDEQDWSAEYSV